MLVYKCDSCGEIIDRPIGGRKSFKRFLPDGREIMITTVITINPQTVHACSAELCATCLDGITELKNL